MSAAEHGPASRAGMEFLARRSHALRTPLNVVLGFSELLLTDELDPLSGPHRAQVAMIQQAGEQLLGQLQTLIDHARLELGTLTIRRTEVDAGQALDLALSALQAEAAQRRIRLQADVDLGAPGTAGLTGDADRVGQILRRLLRNAVRFSPPGSTVRVRATRGDGLLRVVVEDEGAGLTPAQREVLFEPMALQERDAAGLSGSGVGLAVARGLARAMGGELHAEAADRAGCRLVLRLPLAAAAQP